MAGPTSAAATRRAVIKATGGLVLAAIAGSNRWMTPAQAAAAGAVPRVLSAPEAAWLGGLGEAIAPPARTAGLVPYVDHHLAVPHAESLLALRYLDVSPPYADFYRPALASLQRAYGPAPAPDDARWSEILGKLGGNAVAGWAGPPQGLFLFAVRLDAIDIAYGTRAGFQRLGVDYLPHIEPESDW
ncbi:hypothetical protein [Rhizorhabdus phycosphaerae]|uniref:hypothetical protein n=1 Tax=Rhizorhabdus phycosphaerae TaxID=2711156 RepID=UPI001D026158|nr:hypothetical protein [Rhizorhabdus phycosphaerae]